MLIIWAAKRVPVPIHPADRFRVEESVLREMEAEAGVRCHLNYTSLGT